MKPLKLLEPFKRFIRNMAAPFSHITRRDILGGLSILLFVTVWFLLLFFLCSCSTNKHVTTTSEVQSQTSGLHTSEANSFAIDSLLSSLSLQADSIIITITPPPTDSLTPTLRVTAHKPNLQSSTRAVSAITESIQEKDTTHTNTTSTTQTDTSKEVVGVATPMNGTLVTIFVSIAVLIILSIFIYFILKRYKIL